MMNRQKKNVVILFAKKPELGKVKTRIARETSNAFALDFAMACISDLLNKINKSHYYDLIVAADNLDELSWFKHNYQLEGIVVEKNNSSNKELTISDKFNVIFSQALDKKCFGYSKAILIPMDLPFITEEDLITAFSRLDNTKYAYGPERNGGVYLIGIKSPFKKNVFKGVRWSTPYSFNDVLKNSGIKYSYSLKLKNDLNLPNDIIKLKKDIYHNCPILYSFLKKNGYYLPTKNRYVNFDDLSIPIPVISNIIERREGGELKILIQTRYKPSIDPENSGKIEIPSGLIKKYELAQDATIRETEEETGIKITINDRFRDMVNQKNGEVVSSSSTFLCCQQLKGDRSYLSLVFVSQYVGGEIKENHAESRNPIWVSIGDLKKLIKLNPENFFSLSLAALKGYLKKKGL